jgi:S1-C subfamily serine protease
MRGTVFVIASAIVLIAVAHPLAVNAPVTESPVQEMQPMLPAEITPLKEEAPVETPPEPEVKDKPVPAEPQKAEPPVSESPSPAPVPFYSSQPLTIEEVNQKARTALVNILCIGTPPLKSTSGTGILVSDSGMVLTNAHIGQHVLLADSGAAVSCTARIGSPATTLLSVNTVYLPPRWASEHANLLLTSGATGTGESDFALLQLEIPPSEALKSLPLETREDNPYEGAHTLAAYPAEFVGTADVQRNLHALSTSVRVRNIYTFSDNVVDVISLGANPLAQQGASGGAVVNTRGYLVGLITTTTIGETTGDRDLRAITIGHIFRELEKNGIPPLALLSREPSALNDAASQTATAAESLKRTLE